MAADEAWRKALRDFGGVTQVRETVRVREGLAFAENLRRDLGYALRMLKMSPGFAADCDRIAGAGDRREHGDLLDCETGAAGSAERAARGRAAAVRMEVEAAERGS